MAEIKCEVVEHIGIIAEGEWQKELNKVSWNGRKETYDVRSWAEDRKKCSKGITFTHEELIALRDLLNKMEL